MSFIFLFQQDQAQDIALYFHPGTLMQGICNVCNMGTMKWKNFRHPHIELSIIFNCGDRKKIYGDMK